MSLLEVIALSVEDARAAQQGGADRIEVVADMAADGLTPDPDTVAAIRAATAVPIRVMLRANAGFGTGAAELDRLRRAADLHREAGADGFVLGFLDSCGQIDVGAVGKLAAAAAPLPWTFHRALDHAADPGAAWRTVRDWATAGAPSLHASGAASGPALGAASLVGPGSAFGGFGSMGGPDGGLDTVLTAGSSRGVDAGVDVLSRRAAESPAVARMIMAGGGLRRKHVALLAAAGITAFHVGTAVRPDGSWDAPVDPRLVREWRTLVSAATAS